MPPFDAELKHGGQISLAGESRAVRQSTDREGGGEVTQAVRRTGGRPDSSTRRAKRRESRSGCTSAPFSCVHTRLLSTETSPSWRIRSRSPGSRPGSRFLSGLYRVTHHRQTAL